MQLLCLKERNIRDFKAMKAKRFKTLTQSIDLSDFVKQSVDLMRPILKRNQIEIDLQDKTR